ncbi:hypothetical protein PGTUg99_007459 [Puccinia graminis f. sp. tritici]|uniref:Tet-like 2OG-Fe(II) oxygenase domain-containing protein n=1 Tax=Puccinia graminis f. sp. tritici TaxID=56615 RepID=A0A5B0Q1B8_PUCGR|nr:hypothetical protein PGTUg99_007459 [Puccinia graminis f. sp. tritici]
MTSTTPSDYEPESNRSADTNASKAIKNEEPETKLPAVSHELETKPSAETNEGELNASAEENGEPPAKKKRNMTETRKAYMRSSKNKARQKRRKTSRDNEFETLISDQTMPGGVLIRGKRVLKFDLFPEISKELAIEKEKRMKEEQEFKENSQNRPDEKIQKPAQHPLTPRAPTEEENATALKLVEEKFHHANRDYGKIYNSANEQIIGVFEILKIPNLEQTQREDLDFLCAFIHDCKQFVSPAISEGLSCDDISAAIGWSKDLTRLEILPQYRNEESIRKNQEAYSKLMEGSKKAGGILWDIFSTLGNLAAENTRAKMKKLASDGLVSSLAFPSNGFHTDYQVDNEEESDPPLSFAMMIPTFRSTGKIALESEGHRVDNGQFVFPDIKQAISFPPDTIGLMIFRAQQYAHGTLSSTEVGDSTRLGLSIQAPIVVGKSSKTRYTS